MTKDEKRFIASQCVDEWNRMHKASLDAQLKSRQYEAGHIPYEDWLDASEELQIARNRYQVLMDIIDSLGFYGVYRDMFEVYDEVTE